MPKVRRLSNALRLGASISGNSIIGLRTFGGSAYLSAMQFAYNDAEYEQVSCNLCLQNDTEVLARRDRNGLKVQTCMCKNCGLIYINPRMTAEWYLKYYQLEYRAQMARFRGMKTSTQDPNSTFTKSSLHGRGLADRFQGLWEDGLIMEVGSGPGGVLTGLKERLGFPVLGIEPSKPEADFANEKGVKTYCTLFEEFSEEIPAPANILCTQSLNHLLNPRSFLDWAHNTLRPEGLLVLEVLNFRQFYQRYRWMPRAVQIDHTYMFLPEVLSAFVRLAGFDVVKMDLDENQTAEDIIRKKSQGLPIRHIALAARKTSRKPFSNTDAVPLPGKEARNSLRQVQSSFWGYLWEFGIGQFKKTGRI